MSDLIQQILGKNLYILPENHEKFEHFPSLFELRKKFLIKTKIPFLIESKKKFPKWTKSKYSSKVYNFEFVSYVSSLNSEALKDESCLNDDFFLEYNKEKNENFSLAENLGILGSKKVSNNSVKSIFKIKEQLAKNEQNSKAYVFMNKIIEMSESHHSKSLVSSSQDYPNSFITFIEKGLILDGAISTFRSIESNNQSINEVEMSEKKSCADISKPLSRPSHFSKFDLSKINESFKHCISLLGNKLNLKKYHEQSVFSICSLDENTISKTFIENEKTITDFHRKYFSRIYPVGTRIDSSNYDPLYSILAGSQMIALNIQTADIPLLIYSAMFTENGGTNSGYLLKPKFLRHDYNKEKDFYPSMMNTVKKIIKLKILSGQQIAGKNKCLNLHLYLEVSIRGIRLDETENKIFKSEIIKKNLIYVTINLNVEFEIRCPKICFLVFQIFAKNELVSDERLAWYCIPVSCMRQGYRVIQLLNNSLEPHENSLLFVRCQIIKKLG